MIVDCHVHVSACTPEHGEMSAKLQKSLPFRFMRWRLKVKGYDANAERQIAERLRTTLEQTTELDAAVVLAFDSVYDRDGTLNELRDTHLHVKNDYVMELAAAASQDAVRGFGQSLPQRRGGGTGTVHRGGSGAAEVAARDAEFRPGR